jgi:hypothetical protein
MQRLSMMVLAVLGLLLSASPLAAQPRPADPRGHGASGPAAAPAVVPPGDEIKLDEATALRAVANQSRLSAILANAALLQRQFQDLQSEWSRTLEERKKLIDESARKARVDVREVNEWVYDEAGQRYVRSRKKP